MIRLEQLAFDTVPWPATVRRQIFSLFQGPTTAAALCEANFTVAKVFAEAMRHLLAQTAIGIETIDCIASHGQTIWHQVSNGRATSTLQIGDPSVIAADTGITTVGNFRTADVAVGGQGAPLVSLFDWLLLRPQNPATQRWRAVQNIGGLAT
ncbi:MAG: anhydro-N-acetylmuramic acid kinase [Caldilineaceae bacterium]